MFLFSAPTPVNDTPPSAETLAKAKSLPLQDAEGNEHLVSSLMGDSKKLLIIFLRHLHCGFCREYVRACGKNEVLRATTTGENKSLKVVVISHGSYEGINRYKEVSDCPFDMYVDSNKNFYTAFGLTRRYMGKTAGTKEVS
jgi:L-rhamnose 1-dehydrogenase